MHVNRIAYCKKECYPFCAIPPIIVQNNSLLIMSGSFFSAESKPEFNFGFKNFTDFDLQAKCLTGYEQEYQQLSRGKFEGLSKTLLFGKDVGLYFEILNQVLEQAGAVPNDRYLILFLMKNNGNCKINGHNFSSDNVYYARPGTAIHGISGPNARSVAFSINKTFFERVLNIDQFEDIYSISFPDSGILLSNPEYAQVLRRITRQVITNRRSKDPVFNNNQEISLSFLFSELIVKQLITFFKKRTSKNLTHSNNRYKITRNAREIIDQSGNEEISVTQICEKAGVSRRTLEYSFKDCLGLSPNTYLRNIKLNRIRRALMSPTNKSRSIGDIAADHGVWHLSRFAQYYKEHFHELPSQTRNHINPY